MILLLSMGAGAAADQAADEQPPSLEAQVRQLIERLGDPQWHVRQEAHDQLIGLGSDVRPFLERLVAETVDEEVRTRAESALAQIEDDALAGPSFITLRVRDAHPASVFAAIARQSHSTIRTEPENLWQSRNWPGVTVDLQGEPFWEAMRKVCEQLGVSPRFDSNRDGELVITGDRSAWGQAPYTVSGPFMVILHSVNRSHSVDLADQNNIRRNASLQMQVWVEPKIRVMQSNVTAAIEEAVDERGNDITHRNLTAGALTPSRPWNMNAHLTPDANTGQRLVRLRGAGSAVVQTRAERIQIEDVLSARNVFRSVGGQRFILQEVAAAGDNYNVTITIFRTGVQMQPWGSSNIHASLQLLDAEGRPMARERATNSAMTQDSIDVRITFRGRTGVDGQPVGEPARLVWEIPTETRHVDVAFDFADVPLP